MRYVPGRRGPLKGAWSLLLRFRVTSDEEEDYSQITQALPWFWRLSREVPDFFTMEGLRRDGCVLLVCGGPEEALHLAGKVRGSRVAVQIFDPEGLELPFESGTEQRRVRGVYATPRPLVRWIVRSVDALLRSTLGRSEGLADSRVRLLDPAAGPMNFVLECYRQAIARHRLKHGRLGLEALVRGHLLPHFGPAPIRWTV